MRSTCFVSSLLAICILAVQPSVAEAQRAGSPLITKGEALRHGLTRAWFTQVRLDRSRSKIAYLAQAGDTLFVQTDRGLLHALDSETGRTLWTTQIGTVEQYSLAPAANDKFVATVHGSVLYVLSRKDGQIAWSKQCAGAPGAGPAMTGTRVYVPMINGRIEAYELERQEQPPWIYQSFGRAMVQPIATPRSICWPTSRGHLYVGRSENPGIRFRLETNDIITVPPAYKAPDLFAASNDGYLYCVNENSGKERWSFSAGDPISQAPVVIGERVYLCPDRAGIYAIDTDEGTVRWQTPRVTKFIAASPERIYTADRLNRIVVLDAESGARISTLNTVGLSFMHSNSQTDRIYIGTDSGLLQCLHETALDEPVKYVKAETPTDTGENSEPDLRLNEERDGARDQPNSSAEKSDKDKPPPAPVPRTPATDDDDANDPFDFD